MMDIKKKHYYRLQVDHDNCNNAPNDSNFMAGMPSAYFLISPTVLRQQHPPLLSLGILWQPLLFRRRAKVRDQSAFLCPLPWQCRAPKQAGVWENGAKLQASHSTTDTQTLTLKHTHTHTHTLTFSTVWDSCEIKKEIREVCSTFRRFRRSVH